MIGSGSGKVAAIIKSFAAARDKDEDDSARCQRVTIWSDGTRLAGDLWWPCGAEAGADIPAVLLVHGWGGVKEHLSLSYAPRFAAGGFAVLAFDYRGWGDSDGRYLPTTQLPAMPAFDGLPHRMHGDFLELREIVDPLAYLEDIRNALAYLIGQPGVDGQRIGIWGSSLGGGLALHTAIEFTDIVGALIVQIGSVNPKARRGAVGDPAVGRNRELFTRRIAWARGEQFPIPGEESAVRGLEGAMHWFNAERYDPFRHVQKLAAPTLIVDAQDEELFDIRDNGQALYDAIKRRLPARYEVLPGRHYDLYLGDAYERSVLLETAWLQRHLITAPEAHLQRKMR
jgi:uncharacterized protein